MTSHYVPQCWACPNKLSYRRQFHEGNDIKNKTFSDLTHERSSKFSMSYLKRTKPHVKDLCVHKTKSTYPYLTRRISQHILDKICSFNSHRREIQKLCDTKSKAPNYKFKNFIQHFTTRTQISQHTNSL